MNSHREGGALLAQHAEQTLPAPTVAIFMFPFPSAPEAARNGCRKRRIATAERRTRVARTIQSASPASGGGK